ncbi:MAG: hypothetical protein ACXWQO_04735 [Bdellovibrionota bacterium]
MSTLKSSFFVLFVLFLASCGPKDTNSTNAKEMDDRAALRATLSQFEGDYAGTVTNKTDHRKINIEIHLSLYDVAYGTNDKGEVTFRPELQGSFIRSDYVSITPVANRPVRIRYYQETSEFIMDNTDTITSPTPNQGKVVMKGTIRNQVIEGQIRFTIGDTVEGLLQATRTN